MMIMVCVILFVIIVIHNRFDELYRIPMIQRFFIGYCFICYLENRNNKENTNIYTCMASTCIWNGTQFFFISGLLTILNVFVFMVFMAFVST